MWRSDDGRSLAHGVLVDTRIVARVLRVPLLRLDGVVVLSPMSAARQEDHPVVVATPAPLVVGRAPASDGRAIGDGLADVAADAGQAARVGPERAGRWPGHEGTWCWHRNRAVS